MSSVDSVRIDKYLWSIRLFKTRAQAADACDKGKVKLVLEKMGAQSVKPSRNVKLGEQYEVKGEARNWVIKIVGLIDKRVAYPEAIKNYQDMTPQESLDQVSYQASSFHTGKRLSKIGHPSKKDRRDLENFMGDSSIEESED